MKDSNIIFFIRYLLTNNILYEMKGIKKSALLIEKKKLENF